MADACTFCGSAGGERAFLAEAPSTAAAICNVCLAVLFRQLEYKKGLLPSPGVAHMIGEVAMWPGERRLRQFDHVYREGRRTLRGKSRELRGKLQALLGRRAPAPAGSSERAQSASPLGAMFVQHVHPLAMFEHHCAMCGGRDRLIPSPKGARICERCIESWTRTLLG